jgi:hypothetical protein
MARGRKNRKALLDAGLDEPNEPEPARWARSTRRPKYPDAEVKQVKQELSEEDQKILARLVRKYGSDLVGKAVMTVATRGPGRPRRGALPYYERMHLADWIEETAEEYKRDGSRKQYTDAYYELFVMTHKPEEVREPGRFTKFRQTTKKKHHQGRRELILVKAAAERRDAHQPALKKGRE